MTRVNLHFSEDDYKVFYHYCTNYYRLYDETRKNSVKILLELYKHRVIDFQENSLDNVFAFFFQKKQFFETESLVPANSANEMMRIRTCSDIITFLGDLEKIYTLLKRKGIKTNYLLIIGAFSKIIDEENQIRLSEIQEAASGAINSIILPLGDAIERKLGPDIDTTVILKELVNFAGTFNRFSSDIKFTDDTILLVAYSLVKRFNKKESYEDLKTLLSDCLNQFEIDELESALEGDLPAHDDGWLEFSWEGLLQPMNEIGEIIATYKKRMLVPLDVLAALESPVSVNPAQAEYSQLSLYQYPYGMLRKRNDENLFLINVDNFTQSEHYLYPSADIASPETSQAVNYNVYFSLTWGVMIILTVIILSVVFSFSSLYGDISAHQYGPVDGMIGRSSENPFNTVYPAAPVSGVYPNTSNDTVQQSGIYPNISNDTVQQSGIYPYTSNGMVQQSGVYTYTSNGMVQQSGVYPYTYFNSMTTQPTPSPEPTMLIIPLTPSPYVTIEPVTMEPYNGPKSHREEIDALRSIPNFLFDPKDYLTIFQKNFSSTQEDSFKLSYNLKNPPLIIHYTVVPINITDTKWFEPSDTENFIDTAIINRPDEFARFEMKIYENGALLDQAGWGGLFGSPFTTQEFVIRNPGMIQIEFSGHLVTVNLEILVKKEGNIFG